MAEDPYGLSRFVTAQDPIIDTVLRELRAGMKRTHWMWFVFPQLAGLGSSPTAQFYALRSPDEALAYLAHPVLGPRLRACTEAALGVPERSAYAIFGSPDDLKLHSCLTLFDSISGDPVFRTALARFFNGEGDRRTLALLQRG